MSTAIDKPIIVLFEDRPKQAMVFQLNLSIYLDARVTVANDLEELQQALLGPEGVHLVIARAQFKGNQGAGWIEEFIHKKNADVPVISIGRDEARPGLVVVEAENEVRPILQAAAKILHITAQFMVSKDRPGMYEISPVFLNLLYIVPCEVFKLGSNGIVSVFKSGEKVNREKVTEIAKARQTLFIRSMQRLQMVNSVTEQTFEAMNALASPSLEAEQKMTIIAASVDMVAAQFQNSGMDEETVKLANASIKAVEQIADNATNVGKLLKQIMESNGGYRYTHCQLVTFLSFHVIKMLGWWGDEQRSILSQAAFYHDISFKTDEFARIRSEKMFKEAKFPSKEEEDVVLMHPQMAARELQLVPDITQDVLRVVLQHHGSTIGKGFSTDLTELDKLAKVFIMSEEWSDYLIDLSENDSEPNNDGKIKQLKAVYKDDLAHQMLETFRYLDPEEFISDFLSTDEGDFAASLISGGAEAGGELFSKPHPQKNDAPETVLSKEAVEPEPETRISGVTEHIALDSVTVKGSTEEDPSSEEQIIPGEKPQELEEVVVKGSQVAAEEDITLIPPDEAEMIETTTIKNATEHVSDLVVIKGDKSKEYVDRSITVIKADPQKKVEALKLKVLAGSSDLMKAALSASIDKAKEIIEGNKGEVRKTDSDGRTAIHYAAMGGSVDMIRLLIENGAQVSTADAKRRTPIFLAAIYKRNEAFKFLLDQGSKVNQQAIGGMTIAMVAANTGNMEILMAAVEKGIRLDARNHQGKTALDLAKQAKQADIAMYIQTAEQARQQKETTAKVKKKAAFGTKESVAEVEKSASKDAPEVKKKAAFGTKESVAEVEKSAAKDAPEVKKKAAFGTKESVAEAEKSSPPKAASAKNKPAA